MIERKIETELYWRKEFAITERDVEELLSVFLDLDRPLSLPELSQSLIVNYCQRERSLIRRKLTGGTMYRPNGTFSVGEELVFPHLSFARGVVLDQRDGYNPEYGDFQVITVQIDNEERHFAAGFQLEHKLSFSDELSWDEMFVSSAEDLYSRHGERVIEKLGTRLRESPEFVDFHGEWLAKGMMADVHIGYLNIAEAALDMHGGPLPPEELLSVLDLPEEISQPVKVFSLNYAMSRDERFDDVGGDGQVVWTLRRWEPEAVLSPPAQLYYEPVSYDRTKLDVFHLQLEREIDDERSEVVAPPSIADADKITLILGYSHRRVGTLPLTDRTRVFFPKGHLDQHTQFTFVDEINDQEFPGWVVRPQRFVYGLGEWYESNNIPIGAYLTLKRTNDPNRVMIGFTPRRMRREWVRVAFRRGEGEIGFQMRKRPISCEYDELFLLDVDDRAVDELLQTDQALNLSLDEAIQSVFPEIAKLSSLGTVHAKTAYTAVNLVKRCPPGRVFAALFRLPHFVPVGDGYWMFNESVY